MARVLVADDTHDLLLAISDTLRAAGHEVTATDTGADALCLLAAKPPPDLLILDLLMPGLSGYDVLKHLGPTSPPIIVITGESGEESLEVMLGLGQVKRVLLKPFDRDALMEAVNDALKRPAPAAEICP